MSCKDKLKSLCLMGREYLKNPGDLRALNPSEQSGSSTILLPIIIAVVFILAAISYVAYLYFQMKSGDKLKSTRGAGGGNERSIMLKKSTRAKSLGKKSARKSKVSNKSGVKSNRKSKKSAKKGR